MRTYVAALSMALMLSACLPTKQDLATAQAIIEMRDAMNDVRQNIADLQDEIDSLQLQVAKRDTVIKQLANLAGVAVPP